MKPKHIKMQYAKWVPVKALADELQSERGGNVSVPDAISEAVKFYQKYRQNVKKPD